MLLPVTLAVLRIDFLSFLKAVLSEVEPNIEFEDSWHLTYLADVLSTVTKGKCTRLIVNQPPRSLKSITIAVAYVAWRMGRSPGLKVIVTSATTLVARRHAENFSRLIQSEKFKSIFPEFQLESHRVFEQRTTMNGYRIATSIGQGITGLGADLIVVDDPNTGQLMSSESHRRKVTNYFTGTLYTRLTDKLHGQIVIVQQRLHGDDLTGFLMDRGKSYTQVAIPAIAPDDKTYTLSNGRILVRRKGDILLPRNNTQGVMDEAREATGSAQFEAQYQQNPTPADGQIIKLGWVQVEKEMPEEYERKIVSWDTASTLEEDSDYSVGTVWGELDGNYFLLDVIRGKYEPADLYHLIEQSHLQNKAQVTIIENTELGRVIRSYLLRESKIRPFAMNPRFDKVSRLQAQAHKFEAKQIHMPDMAPWRGGVMTELLGFPLVRHDDQVDSISQALHYFSTHSQRAAKVESGDIRRVRRPAGSLFRNAGR